MATACELFQGATIFSKLDLRNTCHLVRIWEGDEWKTDFNTPTGYYEYQVMPLALASLLQLPYCPYRSWVIFYFWGWWIGRWCGSCFFPESARDNKLHPRAFFSHRLTIAEKNYDIGNRELLAINLTLEEWRHWLEGANHPFVLRTDQKNLTYIQGTESLNPLQAQWALYFNRFNFVLSYRPGSKNIKPDALSRHFESQEEDRVIILRYKVLAGILGDSSTEGPNSRTWSR